MTRTTTIPTGMKSEEFEKLSKHDQHMWDVFMESWPSWIKHVDKLENRDDESITVYFKEDGYTTNGCVYIVGETEQEKLFIKRIQGPKQLVSA